MGWIGVDLDGTLAHYDGWRGPRHIGEPIKPMVRRVRRWIAGGQEVRIFTARVYSDGSDTQNDDAIRARQAIRGWCHEVFGKRLPVTNVKDYLMIELWDDRAVQVETNTGQVLGHGTRGLG